ncbi:ATP-binding protein [Clostridium sp. LBM24168]
MKVSIRYKFIIGFMVIFCFFFNIMSLFINNIIIKNNEKIISDELENSQKDLNIYFQQFLVLNNIRLNSGNFEKYAINIGAALSSKLNSKIRLYKNDGKLLLNIDYSNVSDYSDVENFRKDDFKDVRFASKGQSAYRIVRINKKYEAVFSQPLYVGKANIGILRYARDYTELFRAGNNLLINIKVCMIFMFSVLFLFLFFLSTKITLPILKLNNITKKMSKGDYNIDITVNSKDEIGELGQSFNMMRKKIKEQIRTIKEDMKDLIKMERHRKSFFDNVTHDMKTPLTIIDGYAQMILDDGISDKKLTIKAALKIKKESSRLHKMIIDVLNISKVESQSNRKINEKLDMACILENICDDMSIRAKKYDIAIEKKLEHGTYIFANSDDIRKMIVNIIDNSIKYSSTKSIINVNMFKTNDNCNIVVKDNGIGIKGKALERIFEPFYRDEKDSISRIEGNGLGLSIVKSIVDNYKGTIHIESKSNGGTKVYIKIPLFYNLATS